jgi:hypothetical protein
MGATWIKWAIQLLVEELQKKVTPEVLKELLAVAIKAAREGVAGARVKAQATSNPWDDAACALASSLIETAAKALGVP